MINIITRERRKMRLKKSTKKLVWKISRKGTYSEQKCSENRAVKDKMPIDKRRVDQCRSEKHKIAGRIKSISIKLVLQLFLKEIFNFLSSILAS